MAKLSEHGFSTRMFDPAGQDDIGGGCGQLWFVQDWMKNNPDKAKKSVGFGMEVVHAPTAEYKNFPLFRLEFATCVIVRRA